MASHPADGRRNARKGVGLRDAGLRYVLVPCESMPGGKVLTPQGPLESLEPKEEMPGRDWYLIMQLHQQQTVELDSSPTL